MRLVTFKNHDSEALGAIVDEDRIIDVCAACKLLDYSMHGFNSMLALIESGDGNLETIDNILADPPVEALVSVDSVQILAPLPRPQQIRDFVCFEDHVRNSLNMMLEELVANAKDPEAERRTLRASGKFDIPQAFYRKPLYYNASRFSVGGHDDDIYWPAYSSVMDYELELAAVIGKKSKDVPRKNARDMIFGYTIFNDLSARDEQKLAAQGGLGFGKGKDFDSSNIFGPCIVTADEISDPYNLNMIARVNGEEWSSGNSSAMYWKFEDLIEHISQSETIFPGEIYGSGTVGTGCAGELGRTLKSGDVIELEVEKIGVLRNRFISGAVGA